VSVALANVLSKAARCTFAARAASRLVLHPRAEGHAVSRRKHATAHAALALLACRVGDLTPVAPLARDHFLGQPVQVHVILVHDFLVVPDEPDVLLEGEGSLERAGGALLVDAPLRLEVVPHAALDGALDRLLHPGLQRNAAEPALFRSSEKEQVGEREELRDLQTRTKGNEARKVGQEQKMRARTKEYARSPRGSTNR